MKHTLHAHAARHRARKKTRETHFMADIGLIAISTLVSVLLAKTQVITSVLTTTKELELIGSFVAGMFFTSIFTTAPAIATLGELSLGQPILLTAALGAAGAVVGDLLIFRFVKDRIASDILLLLEHRSTFKRFGALFKLRFFRWFTYLLGGIIIASPLPDELGISLLGFSHMNTRYFIVLSFVFNFLGVVAIGFAARALVGV
jgi:hypothetical protein